MKVLLSSVLLFRLQGRRPTLGWDSCPTVNALVPLSLDGQMEASPSPGRLWHEDKSLAPPQALNSLSLSTRIGYDMWKPQVLVVSCVLGTPSYPRDFWHKRAFLPVPQQFDVLACMYTSSLIFQQKLTPQSIKFLNQMLFFFFFSCGNYNHECIQLLVTKEHEEKRWARIALGKILEEGQRHSEDEKDPLTRTNYSNWTSVNLYFG